MKVRKKVYSCLLLNGNYNTKESKIQLKLDMFRLFALNVLLFASLKCTNAFVNPAESLSNIYVYSELFSRKLCQVPPGYTSLQRNMHSTRYNQYSKKGNKIFPDSHKCSPVTLPKASWFLDIRVARVVSAKLSTL